MTACSEHHRSVAYKTYNTYISI